MTMLKGRTLSAALLALLFVVMANRWSESQVSTIEDRVFTLHGGGQNLLSRVDRTLNTYLGSSDVGTQLIDLSAHPSRNNPQWLLAASNSGSVFRLSTNQGVVDKIINTAGPVRGATYVNDGILKPHYMVAEDFAGTTSTAAMEFTDIDGARIVTTLVTGSLGDRFTGVCYSHTDVLSDGNPTNDKFRYFFTNLNATGVTNDTLWVLDLDYNDILQGDPNDPFNPNPVVPGPPFTRLQIQLDANPGKWYQVTSLPSNDDTRMRCKMWNGGGAGNWVVVSRSHFHATTPPTWDVHLTVVNADFATGTVPAEFTTTWGTEFSPPYRNMSIVGNYAIVTYGTSAVSSGGTSVKFFYLPEMADGTADGDNGDRGTWLTSGCDGIGSDYMDLKAYIGTDESDNVLTALNAAPATIDGSGFGFRNDVGVGNVAFTVPTSIPMLTALENNQPNPPNRIYPGRATLGFRIDTNPVVTFPGSGGGGGGGGGCTAGTAAAPMGLALLGLLIGVGVLFMKR